MRWALVVVALAAVAVGLVHIRRDVVRQRHEIRQLAREQVRLRRALWDQQVDLSELTCPQRVRENVVAQSLDLADRTGGSQAALTAATRAGESFR